MTNLPLVKDIFSRDFNDVFDEAGDWAVSAVGNTVYHSTALQRKVFVRIL